MEEIDRMVMFEGAGSGGLLYLPYLNGMACQIIIVTCIKLPPLAFD